MANTAAKKITYDGKPVQVESAIRDGTGKTISSTYSTKAETVTDVSYDSSSKKIQKTINGTTTDVATIPSTASEVGALPSTTTYAASASVGGSASTIAATKATTTKASLLGTALTASGNTTPVFDTGVYLTTTAGLLEASRLNLTSTTDAVAGSNAGVALRIGSSSGQHLDFDGNEIMSKSNASTAAALYLNNDGGQVVVGSGGMSVGGTITGNAVETTLADDSKLPTGSAVTSAISTAIGNISFPVTSVNTETGAVVLDGADISLTGYSKPSSSSAVAATDTINGAIGKLETALDDKIKRGSYERIEGTSATHKNLNSYYTAGFYNVKGQYVDNCPLTGNVDYYLLVMPWNKDKWCSQICVTGNYSTANYNKMWIRSAVDGTASTWSSWKQVATTDSPALTGTPTAPTATAGTNTTQIATTAFVQTAIAELPQAMIFRGTLGTGGTITSLPTAGSTYEGDVYQVITAGTYASQSAKVGDTFICGKTGTSTYEWILIPSGDEPLGTVINVATGVGLTTVSGSAITESGTIKAKLRSETALTNDSAAATETSGRVYPVAVDKSGYLAANVPWTDTMMTQNVSTTNATYPLLACPTADATANQGAKTGIFGSGVKVNPSTSQLIATSIDATQVGGMTKTYTISATGYKTIAQISSASQYWTVNGGNSHIRLKIEYSSLSSPASTATTTKLGEWIVDVTFSGINASMFAVSENGNAGNADGVLRYLAAYAPKTTSYNPKITVANYSATSTYVKVTILSCTAGWELPASFGGDPGTTNYTRYGAWEIGRYNRMWSTNTINASITGNCDGIAGSTWDTINNDRHVAGATAAFVNGSTSYAIRSTRPIGVGSDGKAYQLSTPDKAFKLPFVGGRANNNFSLNSTGVRLYYQQRGIGTSELTTQYVDNTAALTAGATYTGTGTLYAYKWVFVTHGSTDTTATTLTVGLPMYICGNLDSNGNFVPYYTVQTGQTISVPSGQGGFSAATNVTGYIYTFYITQNPTYRLGKYDTFLYFARCDKQNNNYTWLLNTSAITLDANGKLTHIDGKQINNADDINRFGVCSTGATTAAKTVSITSGTFTLEAGATVSVKFSNANTANSPTLNVNSTGAKSIIVGGQTTASTITGTAYLLQGTCTFVYDGTYWQFIGTNNAYQKEDTSNTHVLMLSSASPSSQTAEYGIGYYDRNLYYSRVSGLNIISGSNSSTKATIQPDEVSVTDGTSTVSMSVAMGFVGNLTGNCSGSAGSVAYANITSNPFGTTDVTITEVD